MDYHAESAEALIYDRICTQGGSKVIQSFSITDIGKRRKLNQDYVFSSVHPIGKLPNVFVVADGMGGHNAGDYASKCTVEMMERQIRETLDENPVRILRSAIERANHYIRKQAKEDQGLTGMGTTVVAATVYGNELEVANVGDSRLYIANEKEIVQITRDHSLVEEMVRMGGIDRQTAKVHPDKNIITRAVGAMDTIEADFFQVTLQEGDMILLCSDGLTNMLEDEEIRRITCSSESLERRAEMLIDAANSNGGKDNISVILVDPFADEVRE